MKLCIGLCDDNPLHLRMISQEIQRLCGMREIEAEIHTWASGAQLLKEIETYDIQLYILDIRMPEITGIDAAKQNQSDPALSADHFYFQLSGVFFRCL